MVNTLLKLCKESPCLDVTLNHSFPLAEKIGLPQAFSDEEPDWNLLREHYGKEAVYINYGTKNEWQEVVLTLKNLDEALMQQYSSQKLKLEGYKLDSFTIQAQRREQLLCNKFLGTVIYCFTKSSDNSNMILGVRGGSESIGQAIGVPAGAVGWRMREMKINEGIDSISAALYAEAQEEAGINHNEFAQVNLIGVYRQELGSASPSNVFMYVSNLNIDLEEVQSRHEKAMNIYEKTKCSVIGSEAEIEYKARKKLAELSEEDSTIPKDAWENDHLIIIPNDPGQIINQLKDAEQKEGIKHGLYGAMALYFLKEFGEEEYTNLMKMQSFQKKINDYNLIS